MSRLSLGNPWAADRGPAVGEGADTESSVVMGATGAAVAMFNELGGSRGADWNGAGVVNVVEGGSAGGSIVADGFKAGTGDGAWTGAGAGGEFRDGPAGGGDVNVKVDPEALDIDAREVPPDGAKETPFCTEAELPDRDRFPNFDRILCAAEEDWPRNESEGRRDDSAALLTEFFRTSLRTSSFGVIIFRWCSS